MTLTPDEEGLLDSLVEAARPTIDRLLAEAEALRAALTTIRDNFLDWEHGEECESWAALDADADEPDESSCDCGLAVLVETANAALATPAPPPAPAATPEGWVGCVFILSSTGRPCGQSEKHHAGWLHPFTPPAATPEQMP